MFFSALMRVCWNCRVFVSSGVAWYNGNVIHLRKAGIWIWLLWWQQQGCEICSTCMFSSSPDQNIWLFLALVDTGNVSLMRWKSKQGSDMSWDSWWDGKEGTVLNQVAASFVYISHLTCEKSDAATKKELEMWKRLSGECSGSYCDVVCSISVDGVWTVCGYAFRKLISSSLEQLVHSNFSLQSGGSKSLRKFIDQSRKECFAKLRHKSNGIASAAAAVVSVPIQWALATPERAAFSLCIYAHNRRMWGLWWFHSSLVLQLNLGM